MSARADGEYLELSDGPVHFRIEGPADGAPMVMVHGATVPLWEFDLLAPELWTAGFRTLRFDLFGHGLSSGAQRSYTLELFVRQTSELLEKLEMKPPLTLLGHSIGAAIVSGVASARPERAARVVLIAPLLDFSANIPWSSALRCRGLGEIVMRCVGLPALRWRRRMRYRRIGQPQLIELFRAQSSYHSLGRALLSMIRSATLGDQTLAYARLGETACETLVVWGRRDAVIPRHDVERVRALVPGHRFAELDAEHNLMLTHPREVAALIASLFDAIPREGHKAAEVCA